METVNGCLSDRLDEMEAAIRKTSFRKGTGRANEVNYWVFDYPPEKELEVRARIEYMKGKNARGDDDFDLVVFDLYDVIIDFLEKKRFLEKCYDLEKKNGMERITKAVTNAMKINDNDSLIVQYIKEHTPENAIVFFCRSSVQGMKPMGVMGCSLFYSPGFHRCSNLIGQSPVYRPTFYHHLFQFFESFYRQILTHFLYGKYITSENFRYPSPFWDF